MTDSEWDVDKYKTEHECDEHWELRRKFMLAHQNTLPEDELVCMAQVFSNIEFLGCRYPNETMIRVAELANGVVEEFREKKKGTLKRTFVAASDAASSKVKGLKNTIINKEEEPTPAKQIQLFSKTIKPLDGPFGKFVMLLIPNKSIHLLLDQSVSTNRFHSKKESTMTDNGHAQSIFILNGVELARKFGESKKIAKQLAAEAAFEVLRQQCYSILIKDKLFGQSVTQSDVGANAPITPNYAAIDENNVGRKLMQLMGWEGGGLGSQAQGRVEPIEDTSRVKRAGLGLAPTADNKAVRRAVSVYLDNWIRGGAVDDLVFSSDFTKEQRAIIHQVVCVRPNLKSHSYGSKNNRKVVVSKKVALWDLVQQLAMLGGETGKYKLIDPGIPWESEKEVLTNKNLVCSSCGSLVDKPLPSAGNQQQVDQPPPCAGNHQQVDQPPPSAGNPTWNHQQVDQPPPSAGNPTWNHQQVDQPPPCAGNPTWNHQQVDQPPPCAGNHQQVDQPPPSAGNPTWNHQQVDQPPPSAGNQTSNLQLVDQPPQQTSPS